MWKSDGGDGMRIAALFLISACIALGAVDGVVTNQTTGKPQGGATVTLIELGSGMKNVGSVVSGADGKFTFGVDLQAGTPYLLQAQYEGVNYNRMLPPGSPGTGVTVDVFNSAAKVKGADVSQDMFLLEPTGSEMVVSERIVFTNTAKLTFQDPNGTIKFFVPSGVTGPVQVRVQGPQGMPITRPAEKGPDANTYVIRYAIKPGETNIDVSYTLPMTGNEAKFVGKVMHGGGPVRFVAPAGVKLTGPLEEGGQIPGTSAMAYTLKGREFDLTVTGTGSLRASAPAGAEGGSDEGSQIDARKPLIYERLPWVLAFVFSMLAVGFIILFRREVPVSGGKR
jgi:hypothetical protein